MAVRRALSVCPSYLAWPQPLWEVCWGGKGRTGDWEGVVRDVLGTRIGLREPFSSLEGSIRPLCPRWGIIQRVFAVCLGSLVKCLMGWLKRPLRILQPRWVCSDL